MVQHSIKTKRKRLLLMGAGILLLIAGIAAMPAFCEVGGVLHTQTRVWAAEQQSDGEFTASEQEYLSYDPLYILEYANRDYIKTDRIDMVSFYDVVTAAKGVATYNVRQQRDFEVTETNYIAGISYEMPVYDIDKSGDYYVAIPSVNKFNEAFREYDLMVSYNNDYAEMITGWHYEKGILYIPKAAVDEPKNRKPVPEGSLIAVQLNYAIGGDMDYSKVIPVQVLDGEEPVNSSVTVNNLFDMDDMILDTGVTGREKQDVSVYLNGSLIPAGEGHWEYDSESGQIRIMAFPGVISNVNVLFEPRTVPRKMKDAAASAVAAVTEESFADVSVSSMRTFKNSAGNEIVLDLNIENMFVGWRGYYNGKYKHGPKDSASTWNMLEGLYGWKNSLEYMYGGQTDQTGTGWNLSDATLDKNLAPLWAISSYALGYDIGVSSSYGELTKNEQIRHWDRASQRYETKTIYEWLNVYKNRLERNNGTHGEKENGNVMTNGLGGFNNFAFTLPKKITGAERSLVSSGENEGKKNKSIKLEASRLGSGAASDSATYYNYWIAAGCNHLDMQEGSTDDNARDAAIYVTCLGVENNGEDSYVVLAFVQSAGDSQSQNACGIYKFRTTGTTVEPVEVTFKVKKESKNTNYTEGNDSYSLKGAEFGVYGSESDAENKRSKLDTLTTKANGETGLFSCEFESADAPAKSFWVRELKAPKGYQLPEESYIKQITIRPSDEAKDPVVMTYKDEPETGVIQLKKVSTIPDLPAARRNMTGARYGIYDDEACRNSTKYTSDGETRTLTITEADGEFVSNKVRLAIGEYWIKETAAPDGFEKDEQAYKITIGKDHTTDTPKRLTMKDKPEEGKFYIKKTPPAARASFTANNPNYNIAGAVYSIYDHASCTSPITYGTNSLTTKADGTTEVVSLPTGTYWVKETRNGTVNYKTNDRPYTVTITKANTEENPAQVKVEDDPETGWLKLRKDSGNPSISEGNRCYSLAGAEYRIYNNEACTEETKWTADGQPKTLATDVNGNTGSVELGIGSYYIREVKAAEGYALDPAVYPIKITKNHTQSQPLLKEVSDLPQGDLVFLIALKGDAEIWPEGNTPAKEAMGEENVFTEGFEDAIRKHNHPIGGTRLEGAKFTVRYYDVRNGTKESIADQTPLRTWVFETDSNGAVRLDRPPVSGDDLYVDHNGKSIFPIGTYAIQETEAPEGYKINSEIRIAVVTEVKNASVPEITTYHTIDGEGYPWFREFARRGDFELVKEDSSGHNRLAGIPFMIRSATNGETHVAVTDENGTIRTDSGWNSHSDRTNGNDYVINTDRNSPDYGKPVLNADGFVDESKLDPECGIWFGQDINGNRAETAEDTFGGMPYDTYYLTELPVTANADYRLIRDVRIVIRKDGVTIDLKDVRNNHKEEIGTEAVDQKTRSHLTKAEENAFVTDTVTYSNLEAGKTYTIRGKAVDKTTGAAIEGLAAEKTFTAKSGNGNIGLEFRFDASAFAGKAIVFFEYLYEEGEEEPVASHEDLQDEDQTIYIPEIGTVATDKETGLHRSTVSDQVTIIDTVFFEGLAPGEEYTVRGELIDKATGKPAGLTAEKRFSPEASAGSVELEFTFDASGMEGRSLVAFETLYETGGKIIAEHKDIEDEKQTVNWPQIGTLAQNAETGSHLANAGQITITDTVEYRNLIAGEEHTMRGVLMDKSTGKPLTVNGKEITSEVKFTPQVPGEAESEEGGTAAEPDQPPENGTEADGSQPPENGPDEPANRPADPVFVSGTVTIEFRFDASVLAGKTLVTFETLLDAEGAVVGEHKDLDDADQSIYIPKIATTATEKGSGTHEAEAAGRTEIIDAVRYHNLIPGLKYTVEGELMDKETGRSAGVTAKAEFVPAGSSGEVMLSFTADTSKLAGHSLVAFETLKFNGKQIAEHKDPDDADQTVRVRKNKEPSKPVEKPTNPGDPTKPPLKVEQVVPTKPDSPTSPGTPAIPDRPDTPDGPGNPTAPGQPAQHHNPGTGDPVNPAVPCAMAALCFAAAVTGAGALLRRRRKG